MVSPPAAAEMARNQVSASCRPSSLTVELDEEPLPVRLSCLDIEGRIRVAQTPLARATQPVGGAGCPNTQDFPRSARRCWARPSRDAPPRRPRSTGSRHSRAWPSAVAPPAIGIIGVERLGPRTVAVLQTAGRIHVDTFLHGFVAGAWQTGVVSIDATPRVGTTTTCD